MGRATSTILSTSSQSCVSFLCVVFWATTSMAMGSAATTGHDSVAPWCRCTQPACLAGVPFDQLNASVGGRLIVVEDEVAACVDRGMHSPACQVC
jgi:hypothetical protein